MNLLFDTWGGFYWGSSHRGGISTATGDGDDNNGSAITDEDGLNSGFY